MNQSQITLLRWMFEDLRKETLEGVNHLTKEQLMQNPIEGEYPIGSYLLHLAECDIYWLEQLSGIEQPEELKKRSFCDKWFDPPEAPEPPKETLEINYYLDVINEARLNFLNYVSSMSDEQLEEIIHRKGNVKTKEMPKKWIIYHLLEHEAHHRGQMFMLIRKAGWNKK
ncbi:MAG: DinB family protein [Bacteroidota bacterium]|nr:DinB family protein [Bacteroidota bacterium]